MHLSTGVLTLFGICRGLGPELGGYINVLAFRPILGGPAGHHYSQNSRQYALFILYGIYGVLHDGSEAGLSIELIDKNMRNIIPLFSNILGIPTKIFMKGGE